MNRSATDVEKLLESALPWMGVMAGPVATILYVRQWNPTEWMETTVHILHVVSMLQMVQLLGDYPGARWGFFTASMLHLVTWILSWSWRNMRTPEVDVAASAVAAVATEEGRNILRYSYITMGVGALTIFVNGLLFLRLASVPLLGVLGLIALVVLCGGLYVLVNLPKKTLPTDPTDILALFNFAIGLFAVLGLVLAFDRSMEADSFFQSMPMLSRPFLLPAVAIVSTLAFLAMGSAWSKKEDTPKYRPLRVATGTTGTVATIALLLWIARLRPKPAQEA